MFHIFNTNGGAFLFSRAVISSQTGDLRDGGCDDAATW